MNDEGMESKEGMDAKKPRLPEKEYCAILIVDNALETLNNGESA